MWHKLMDKDSESTTKSESDKDTKDKKDEKKGGDSKSS